MRFRTLALALALCCGTTGMVEAKQKVHKVSYKKSKGYKNKSSRAAHVKPRKAKKFKAQKRTVR